MSDDLEVKPKKYKAKRITIPGRLIPHIKETLIYRLYDDNLQDAVIHMIQNALQEYNKRRDRNG